MMDDSFVAHRGLLFTVAYEMLGSATGAEDVVQETWLRWADVDRAEVRGPPGLYGSDRHPAGAESAPIGVPPARGLSREWLLEPLLTGPDMADGAVLAENVSVALLCAGGFRAVDGALGRGRERRADPDVALSMRAQPRTSSGKRVGPVRVRVRVLISGYVYTSEFTCGHEGGTLEMALGHPFGPWELPSSPVASRSSGLPPCV